mmetsp:Transcript_12939/g.16045  ORF Transcript_12939/g.16045 Transcript_12939/m.16045 type:complete len:283 (+) Transcript_12939:844-1692(+)
MAKYSKIDETNETDVILGSNAYDDNDTQFVDMQSTQNNYNPFESYSDKNNDKIDSISNNNNNNNDSSVGIEGSIKGNIGISYNDDNIGIKQGTLDESICETIMRDLKRIGNRLKHVLIPFGTDPELKDWDLWGPLLLCLTLATSLSLGTYFIATKEDKTQYKTEHYYSLIFTIVFVIIWIGSFIITINARLLGGKISIFQSISVFAYCIFPLNIASVLTFFIEKYMNNKFYLKEIIVFLCLLWSIKASTGFMEQMIPKNKRLLAVYPVSLFYVVLSWMIILQ